MPWDDQRVLDTLNWVKGLVDAGLLPKTFTTLKLAEAHIYFHTKPGSLHVPEWELVHPHARSIRPTRVDRLRTSRSASCSFPPVPGAACNECRTIAVGGGYVGNAGTEHPEAVLAFFSSFLSPEIGTRWLDNVMVQTGIVSDPSRISRRQAADYFQMIARTNAGSKYFFGIPIQVMQGKAKEVFIQVINNAFPAGKHQRPKMQSSR